MKVKAGSDNYWASLKTKIIFFLAIQGLECVQCPLNFVKWMPLFMITHCSKQIDSIIFNLVFFFRAKTF